MAPDHEKPGDALDALLFGSIGPLADGTTRPIVDTIDLPPDHGAAPERLHLGEVLNDTYEIRAPLGAGGMGAVFEAHDRVLNRRVAIKAGHIELDRSFLRLEAQALAAIRHPAMVTVHGFGSHRGIEYIVMERVYGVSVESQIARLRYAGERFTIDEALDVLIALADGLLAVHRAGIAHRDVKPGNVMLAPGNRVVLVDFGLFVQENQVAPGQSAAGSPGYMAPEIIRGAQLPGTAHLADVYALGITAYEMLAGHLPFDAGSLEELYDKHLHSPVPDLVAERPDVPPSLVTLLESMLAKSTDQRPQSMEAVAWQLRAVRGSVHSTRETPVARADAFPVLIVDDDAMMTLMLTMIVREAIPGAQIEVARDGEKALEMVRRGMPRLMLLDLQMPGMNGIEVCMHLRATHLADRCTVVSVSGRVQGEDFALLQQLGITRFVPKGGGLRERLVPVVREIHRAG